MEALKAELARKRKQLEDSKIMEPGKKFFKRHELLAKQEEEYLKKNCPKEGKLQATTSKTECTADGRDDTSAPLLPRKEVIRKLRDRGQPILLYGESEVDAFKRLRILEIIEPEVDKGMRNDFQEALEQVDQDVVQEILHKRRSIQDGERGETSETSTSSPTEVQQGEDKAVTADKETPTASAAEYQDEEDDSWEKISALAAKHLDSGDRNWDMKITTRLLKFLLKMWGEELKGRSQQEKSTSKGKNASAMYTQTKVYLEPLFSKLQKATLPDDISDSLTEIIKHLLNRNYIMANDAYLQMAIGNAPWPIGVTMVGIHARTGREKIFSKNVAHVMNDETQRKYIQGLKRLMTKCQQYFTTDPSRCVEYAAFNEREKPSHV
jgi:pre-mRNA-splicing factor 18